MVNGGGATGMARSDLDRMRERDEGVGRWLRSWGVGALGFRGRGVGWPIGQGMAGWATAQLGQGSSGGGSFFLFFLLGFFSGFVFPFLSIYFLFVFILLSFKFTFYLILK